MKQLPFKLGILVGVLIATTFQAIAAPKYGPDADPLWKKSHTEYFKENDAPDFWALSGYYVSQLNPKAPYAAAFVMVANALRTRLPLTREDGLVTVQGFSRKLDPADPGEFFETFVVKVPDHLKAPFSNRDLERTFQNAVEKLGISKVGSTSANFVELPVKADLKTKTEIFHNALVANERSSDDFMIISFVQARLTGDPDGGAQVGVIGAYDAKKKSVLIFDPDRQYYEPYWSPEAAVFEAISNPKSDSQGHVGWFHIQRPRH